MTHYPSAWERGPSYKRYFEEPLGTVMNSFDRSFMLRQPARDFRNGVKTELDEAWWEANVARSPGHAPEERLRRGEMIKTRLLADSAMVTANWHRSLNEGSEVLPEILLCQTLLGKTVYEALAARGLPAKELLTDCGKAYGALLKSLLPSHKGMRAPGEFSYFQGKPQSRVFEGPPIQLDSLSHRGSSVFFPISRLAAARW